MAENKLAPNFAPISFPGIEEGKIYAEDMVELMLFGEKDSPTAYTESGKLKPVFKLWACLTYMKSVIEAEKTGRRALYAEDIVRLHESKTNERLHEDNLRDILTKYAGYEKDPRQQHFGPRKPAGIIVHVPAPSEDEDTKTNEEITNEEINGGDTIRPEDISDKTQTIPDTTYSVSDDGHCVVQKIAGMVSTFTSTARISVSFGPADEKTKGKKKAPKLADI